MVFLDTYQKATPGLNSFDDAAQSHLLHRLLDLTRRRGLTLLVNDHLRKQPAQGKRRQQISKEEIKGTGGKVANTDCVILLARTTGPAPPPPLPRVVEGLRRIACILSCASRRRDTPRG